MKAWLKERRKRQDHLKYIRGFQWAMAEYYLAKKTVDDISLQIDNPFDRDNFERGAAYALKIIEDRSG